MRRRPSSDDLDIYIPVGVASSEPAVVRGRWAKKVPEVSATSAGSSRALLMGRGILNDTR